ncbi:MAG: succinyl-diaminopimelate desuccinylase [Alphaproteobacteria bacterium CG_4_10_14_0_2_um_filter_63_37]|nr:MAG: succinyl-diaminopimelate desuccinylase [Proteobacteria bacterium CG1_02_64_396]PJA26054.1 MAG: succinyl-diaminopimelate desuccinylase [Alphaproteobacteria bacterium CG_4_10_14_0_2_um_filter_63_37]
MPDCCDPVALAQALIRFASVTPEDHGCQAALADWCITLGGRVEWMPFGNITNLVVRFGAAENPRFCLAGHTDVVPVGRPESWTVAPFGGEVIGGFLYGRGAVDMKGAIAAMVAAIAREKRGGGDPEVILVITGDEEGDSVDGTDKMLHALAARGALPEQAVVGEPTNPTKLGQTIKNGRRGTVNGTITILGMQGHAAYPAQADNPIHRGLPALHELASLKLDDGYPGFSPTSIQITNLNAGVGASNVIPGRMSAVVDIRYSPAINFAGIETAICQVLERHNLRYELELVHHGVAFATPPGPLVEKVRQAVVRHTGMEPELSTSGGTSDARFFKVYGVEVVEFGLVGQSMHRADERTAVDDLERLTEIYRALLR